ncbi:MAG: hypothetical protein WDW36_002381 [Sanguina aurantia]
MGTVDQQCEEDFTLTTPLYYVNAAPHMGSAYPTIAADVLARFQRLQGKRVRFITGTDEHGEKIAVAAEKRGLSPQAHCDDIVTSYKSLWKQLDISYDRFVRTTESSHEALVTAVLARVWAAGDIYMADYEGFYCVDCEEYKDEKEMDEQHNCPTHRRPCTHRKESNYFFKLSRYQKELEALLVGNESFVQPSSRRNELLTLIKDNGVRDFSISRSAVAWGIPMTQDPKHTVYVWFDALIGYLSALIPPGETPTVESLTANGWPASVHIIGKDILRFHAVYWPGMLLSAGLPVPKLVFGHGFLTKDGLKMGKSMGNTLDPFQLVNTYGADAVRFFFMREIVFGQDGDFSEVRFRDTVNSVLANNVGNMLNRTLNLLAKNCDSTIAINTGDLPADLSLRVLALDRVSAASTAYTAMSFHEALEAATQLSSAGNTYLEATAPWLSLKKGNEEEKAAAVAVLVTILELVRVVAVMLLPVTPSLAGKIYSQLGFTEAQFLALTWRDTAWGGISAGHVTAQPEPVFKRLESEEEKAAAAAGLAPGQASQAATSAESAEGTQGAEGTEEGQGRR